jgi:hypothetical protein
MTCQFTNNGVATFLAVVLYGKSNVTNTITGLGLFDTDIETLLRCTQQAENLLVNLAYREGVTTVAIETIDDSATVASDNVSILKFIIRGEAVYYLVIDLDAESARESIVSLETRDTTMITDKLFGDLVKL